MREFAFLWKGKRIFSRSALTMPGYESHRWDHHGVLLPCRSDWDGPILSSNDSPLENTPIDELEGVLKREELMRCVCNRHSSFGNNTYFSLLKTKKNNFHSPPFYYLLPHEPTDSPSEQSVGECRVECD